MILRGVAGQEEQTPRSGTAAGRIEPDAIGVPFAVRDSRLGEEGMSGERIQLLG